MLQNQEWGGWGGAAKTIHVPRDSHFLSEDLALISSLHTQRHRLTSPETLIILIIRSKESVDRNILRAWTESHHFLISVSRLFDLSLVIASFRTRIPTVWLSVSRYFIFSRTNFISFPPDKWNPANDCRLNEWCWKFVYMRQNIVCHAFLCLNYGS